MFGTIKPIVKFAAPTSLKTLSLQLISIPFMVLTVMSELGISLSTLPDNAMKWSAYMIVAGTILFGREFC